MKKSKTKTIKNLVFSLVHKKLFICISPKYDEILVIYSVPWDVRYRGQRHLLNMVLTTVSFTKTFFPRGNIESAFLFVNKYLQKDVICEIGDPLAE